MIEITCNDRLGKKVRVKCNSDDTIGDLKKLIAAWESWEKGEEQPGRTLASLKTAGMATVLQDLVANGWSPASK